MTLAKSVVTGTVFRTPEKRFTQNNVAVYSLILNIGDREETLIRVFSSRSALESVMRVSVKVTEFLLKVDFKQQMQKWKMAQNVKFLKSMPQL